MPIYLMVNQGQEKNRLPFFMLNFFYAVTQKTMFHVKHATPVDASHPVITRM